MRNSPAALDLEEPELPFLTPAADCTGGASRSRRKNNRRAERLHRCARGVHAFSEDHQYASGANRCPAWGEYRLATGSWPRPHASLSDALAHHHNRRETAELGLAAQERRARRPAEPTMLTYDAALRLFEAGEFGTLAETWAQLTQATPESVRLLVAHAMVRAGDAPRALEWAANWQGRPSAVLAGQGQCGHGIGAARTRFFSRSIEAPSGRRALRPRC